MFDNQLENELNGLSPEERNAVLKILQEYSVGDNSSTFNNIVLFELNSVNTFRSTLP